MPAVKNWAKKRVTKAEDAFRTWTNEPYQVSPPDWAGEIVYSIQVDRFNNGDLTNDNQNLPEGQPPDWWKASLPGGPVGLPGFRHGGDLQGIFDRLGYLQMLGVTTLWITPILKHNGAYHGYCTTDPTKIDPGFGTAEKLRDLVRAAHNHGMRVVMDIVVNHLCDPRGGHYDSPNHKMCAQDDMTGYWNGSPGQSSNAGSIPFSREFFAPFKTQAFFNRCGPNSVDEMQGEGPAAVFGDFTYGMLDYDTRNYDWQEIFTDLHKYWIAFADIDGYRMDAAKHVTADFLAYFSTNIRDYARSLGKDNFYLIGEVAASEDWVARSFGRMETDPSNPDNHDDNIPNSLTSRIWSLKDVYQKNSKFPFPGPNAVYNFAQSGTARDAILGKRQAIEVQNYFKSSAYSKLIGQTVSMKDCFECWTMLEIHDWPRFLRENPRDSGKLMAGLAFLLTAPGAPILYYGVEQGFNGNCGDQINAGPASDSIRSTCGGSDDSLKRQDFFPSGPWLLGSADPAIDSQKYIGFREPKTSKFWWKDPLLRTDGSIFQMARKLVHLRKSCNALMRGSIFWRRADFANGGILAFSRILGPVEIIAIVNPGESGDIPVDKLAIDGGLNTQSGQKYRNVFAWDQVGWTGFENGAAYLYFPGFTLPAGSAAIFVHENNLQPFDSSLGIALCKPEKFAKTAHSKRFE